MIKHSMEIVRAAVQHFNPDQVSVLALDQSLYVLAKQIQSGDMANQFRRGPLCTDVRWITHRDGYFKGTCMLP